MPRASIAVSGESYINNAVKQEEAWPLILPFRVKGECAVHAAVPCARNSRRNDHRTAEFLRSGGYVEGVEPQDESDAFQGLTCNIQRTCRRINHGSSRDAH